MKCSTPGFLVLYYLPEFCSDSCPVSWLLASGGQSIGASASASVLPMNIQDWFPLVLTSWISLQSKGLLRFFSRTTIRKHQFFDAQPSLWSSCRICAWLLGIALTIWTFVGKVTSLLFNMLSGFAITFLHGCSHHLQWFRSPRKENLSLLPLFSHLFSMEWWDQMPWS